MKNKLSLRTVESLLSKAGAKRCSEKAKIQLSKSIHEHAKRKTIKK